MDNEIKEEVVNDEDQDPDDDDDDENRDGVIRERHKYLKQYCKVLDHGVAKFRSPHHYNCSVTKCARVQTDNFQDVFRKFPFAESETLAISDTASDDMLKVPDDILDAKRRWKDSVTYFKSYYKRRKFRQKYRFIRYTEDGKVIVPLCLWKFVRLLTEDPDKYFDSMYNWYRTGNGNLTNIRHDNVEYLIQSVNDKLYSHTFEDRKLKMHSSVSLGNENQIYETLTHGNVIGLRQRNMLHLMNFNSASDSTFEKLGHKSSEIPFCSFSFRSDEICYSKVDDSICFDNFEFSDGTTLREPTEGNHRDNWSSLRFSDDGSIVCTTAKKIEIFDRRTKDAKLIVENVRSDNCDDFTVSEIVDGNQLFACRSHNLYLFDIRNVKRPTAKWFHGFRTTPMFINVEKFNEYVLAIISTPYIDEQRIIVFDSSGTKLFMPYTPDNIRSTLRKAQLGGYCLDISFNYKGRFELNRTGTLLRKNDTELDLFTSNVAGDVFHQYLSADMRKDDTNLEDIERWFHLAEKKPTKFTVSRMYDADMWKRRVLFKPRNPKYQDRFTPLWKRKIWTEKELKMKSCKDACSGELLAAWDITNVDNEHPSTFGNTQFDVNNWLHTSTADFA